jgi:hypothetical protein
VESFPISLSPTKALLIVLFAVMVNVLTAVCTVDPDLVNLASAFKATRTQIFWKIGFPCSVPPMFAGLRTGSTLVVVVVWDAAHALPPNIGHGSRLRHDERALARRVAGIPQLSRLWSGRSGPSPTTRSQFPYCWDYRPSGRRRCTPLPLHSPADPNG